MKTFSGRSPQAALKERNRPALVQLVGTVLVLLSILVLTSPSPAKNRNLVSGSFSECEASIGVPAGFHEVESNAARGRRVILSWSAVPGAIGYRVYRSLANAEHYRLAGGISSETMSEFPFFVDEDIRPGKSYRYRVCALDSSWNKGNWSAPLDVSVPPGMKISQVEKQLICSLEDQRLYCFENGSIVNNLRCSTGVGGTPTGNFRIYSHRRYVYGATYVCEYWMDWKPNYGIHSWPRYRDGYRDYEESLGVRPRSHGCIRLHPLEAYWPYNWAPNGTPLLVTYASLGKATICGTSASSGTPAPAKKWYFAEGYTGTGFQEYLLFLNPGESEALARTTYFPENQPPLTEVYFLKPQSRTTIKVNDVVNLPAPSHAIMIESGVGIVVQQAMYFEYAGRRGGHVTNGISSPTKSRHFAEGYTGPGFDTYLLIFNPNRAPAEVRIKLHTEGGIFPQSIYTFPPLSRGTILVNALEGATGHSLGIEVKSSGPVVAQRSTYFTMSANPNGLNGGHSSSGVAKPSKNFYLAEGCTAGLFDEYILLVNPNPIPAFVSITFCPPTGPFEHRFSISPFSRYTLAVDSISELANTETPSIIESDRPIVVERAMYYSLDSKRDGHSSEATEKLSRSWYFAEGYTGGTFDEYLLLFNPNKTECHLRVSFYGENGETLDFAASIPPMMRLTLHVDEIPSFGWRATSCRIESDLEIAAEQAHYFTMSRR